MTKKRKSTIWALSKEEIQEKVNKCNSISDMLESFGYKRSSGSMAKVMKEVIQDFSGLSEELRKLFGFPEKEKYYLPIRKTIGSIIIASNYFLWEEEYDASQEEATAFYIPCNDIIEHLENQFEISAERRGIYRDIAEINKGIKCTSFYKPCFNSKIYAV